MRYGIYQTHQNSPRISEDSPYNILNSNRTEYDNTNEQVDPNESRLQEAFSRLFSKSAEDIVYTIIQDIANGKIDYKWFQENAGNFINSFPPSEYLDKHPEDFTPEKCRAYLQETKTAEEFAKSALFQTIMGDETVLDRYQKVAKAWHLQETTKTSEGIHKALIELMKDLDEYKDQEQEVGWTADVPEEKVSGWRDWIKRILG